MPEEIKIINKENFEDYPLLKRLSELHDIPEKIYIKGEIPNVTLDEYGRATPRILSIIGSRKNTSYGETVTKKLIDSLSGQNIIILSGLAYGIDSLAHKNAIKSNLKTIAIPGSGLAERIIYPQSHVNLAKEIVERGGLLLSELSPDTGPAQWTFPARNRIVAALSDAILIIEASDKSGALITARQGLELGRDIGAVPGEIFSSNSLGTNSLIKDGAYIITNEDDLFSLLHLNKEKVEEEINNNYNQEEKIILDILIEPMQKDLLFIKSNMTTEKFLRTISELEMKGKIEENFGEIRRTV